ncbi:MAG: hypothetical protein FJZ63_04140 [Chlamydiae bacterium]|nr:hypothetical protein [Chlamydiota bacterium]
MNLIRTFARQDFIDYNLITIVISSPCAIAYDILDSPFSHAFNSRWFTLASAITSLASQFFCERSYETRSRTTSALTIGSTLALGALDAYMIHRQITDPLQPPLTYADTLYLQTNLVHTIIKLQLSVKMLLDF